MTTPSQTPEAAGLEVVAWRWGLGRNIWNYQPDCPSWVAVDPDHAEIVEPLVTAASAQARIEAAEARADRLAGVEDCLNDRAEACLSIVATAGDDPSKARVASKAQAYFHAAELVRAALQQEG